MDEWMGENGVIVVGSDDREKPETQLPFNGCYT
jgi:hypothetical protein